jgi:hypothetical protein
VALASWLRSLLQEQNYQVVVLVLGLFFSIFLLFYALHIKISNSRLEIRFGIGLIKWTYTLDQISAATVVKNPWYYFWGIKSIRGGWFIAANPGTAVQLNFADGRIIRLGSFQPEALKKALDRNLQRAKLAA